MDTASNKVLTEQDRDGLALGQVKSILRPLAAAIRKSGDYSAHDSLARRCRELGGEAQKIKSDRMPLGFSFPNTEKFLTDFAAGCEQIADKLSTVNAQNRTRAMEEREVPAALMALFGEEVGNG